MTGLKSTTGALGLAIVTGLLGACGGDSPSPALQPPALQPPDWAAVTALGG